MSRLNGGPQHGILFFLNLRGAQGARAKEIVKAFPSTESSSILTIMRRNGLIAKAGVKLTTPWIITVKGQELLVSLPTYTPAMYWGINEGPYGRDEKHLAEQMYREPAYYGKEARTTMFGWDLPTYMARKSW